MNSGLANTTRRKPSATASAVLTRGTAREIARVFVAGNAVAPFSVGSCGDWRVAAAGVEALHFYLCFDGQALFAVPAAGATVSLPYGKRLMEGWTELPDGCVLTFGAASIAVTNLGKRAMRSRALPASRVDARGPRIVDPFACETLVRSLRSPLTFAAGEALEERTVMRPTLTTLEKDELAREPLEEPTLLRPANAKLEKCGAPCEPLEEPTLWRRPAAGALALAPFVRAADASLAQTMARPVTSPMAITLNAPMPSAGTRPPELAPASPSAERRTAAAATFAPIARTPLLRKGMAGLVVVLLVLMSARSLIRRLRTLSVKAVAAAPSASSRSATAARGAPKHGAASTDDKPRHAEALPLPVVNGKTPQRQAVDLVARGAYSEAAVLYERLASGGDVPAFHEAARIARRKARLAR